MLTATVRDENDLFSFVSELPEIFVSSLPESLTPLQPLEMLGCYNLCA